MDKESARLFTHVTRAFNNPESRLLCSVCTTVSGWPGNALTQMEMDSSKLPHTVPFCNFQSDNREDNLYPKVKTNNKQTKKKNSSQQISAHPSWNKGKTSLNFCLAKKKSNLVTWTLFGWSPFQGHRTSGPSLWWDTINNWIGWMGWDSANLLPRKRTRPSSVGHVTMDILSKRVKIKKKKCFLFCLDRRKRTTLIDPEED